MENGGSCSPSPATPLSDWRHRIHTHIGGRGERARDEDKGPGCVCLWVQCESSVCVFVFVWGVSLNPLPARLD